MNLVERIVVFAFVYGIGAIFVQQFCSNVILKIPLLDEHALKIRNFLCMIWLILCVLGSIFYREE